MRACLSVCLATLLACGSHKAPAPTAATAATAAPSAAPAASSVAEADAGGPAPPEPPDTNDSLLGAVDAPDPVMDELAAGIRKLTESRAPKTRSESSSTIRKGGSISDKAKLLAGRCYTVLGYSPAGGATEIKVSLGKQYTAKSKPAKPGEPTTVVLLAGKAALCVKKDTEYAIKIEATKGMGPLAVELVGRPDSN